MTTVHDNFDDFRPSRSIAAYLKRLAMFWGFVALAGLVAFLLLWKSFFVYVAPGNHLVTIAKNGDELPSGQVLADAGQKGVLREVQGEGWHFVMPVVYQTERHDNTV